MNWLSRNTLLTAHNCRRFGGISSQPTFKIIVYFIGLVQKSTHFRIAFPSSRINFQTSINTRKRLQHLKYDAHNAKEDVSLDLLHQLVTSTIYTINDMMQYSGFFFFFIPGVQKHIQRSEKNFFKGLIRDKLMTKNMCEKAAASGLTFYHVKFAYNRNGFDVFLLRLG